MGGVWDQSSGGGELEQREAGVTGAGPLIQRERGAEEERALQVSVRGVSVPGLGTGLIICSVIYGRIDTAAAAAKALYIAAPAARIQACCWVVSNMEPLHACWGLELGVQRTGRAAGGGATPWPCAQSRGRLFNDAHPPAVH